MNKIIDEKRNKIIQDFKEKFKSDPIVIGLILTGSFVSHVQVNKNSDLDFIVIITENGGKFEFYYDKKIWVEIFYEDEERIKKCFYNNDEIMINCFKNGKILIDSQGKIAQLKKIAELLTRNYKISNYNLNKIRYRLHIMLLKVENAYLEKNTEKMIFLCIYTLPYLIRGIYIVNRKIPPTLSSWYDRDKLLELKGGKSIVNLFETLRNSSDNKIIDKLYKDFIILNIFLNSKMGGSLKEWKDKRKEQFQTFL